MMMSEMICILEPTNLKGLSVGRNTRMFAGNTRIVARNTRIVARNTRIVALKVPLAATSPIFLFRALRVR